MVKRVSVKDSVGRGPAGALLTGGGNVNNIDNVDDNNNENNIKKNINIDNKNKTENVNKNNNNHEIDNENIDSNKNKNKTNNNDENINDNVNVIERLQKKRAKPKFTDEHTLDSFWIDNRILATLKKLTTDKDGKMIKSMKMQIFDEAIRDYFKKYGIKIHGE